MRPLKVVLAVWVNELGMPHRGSTYEHAHFTPALIGMGCEVTVFDLAATLGQGPVATTAKLRRLVDKLDPDLVLMALYEDDLDPEALRAISERTTTFNWFADDHWRFESFSRRWAPCFTWASTTDREAVARYADAGIHNVLPTQWAAAIEVYHPQGLPLEHEVSFVGQVYGGRRALIEDLRTHGVPVEAFGTGWATRLRHRVAGRLPGVRALGGSTWAERVRTSTRLDLSEMVRVFETSRINLNLAESSHGTRPQIKGRVFEVPAAGGFLLTQPAVGLEDYLVPGEEIAVFEDQRDLVAQVRWWLDHEDERRAVAARGLARVRAEHTYEHRFRALFAQMGFPLL